MITILSWIVWGLRLIVTIGFSYGIIRSIQIKKPFSYAIAVQTLSFLIMLGVFYFNPQWSKFHILWFAPLIFLLIPFLTSRFFIR